MGEVEGLPRDAVYRAVAAGGLIGIPAALLGPLLGGSALGLLVLGLIFEAAKLIGFLVVRSSNSSSAGGSSGADDDHDLRPAFVQGAAVGLGFGIVVAIVPAITALVRGQVLAIVLIALGPLAQGFFTAILSGLLIARARLDPVVFWSYAGVAVLHALWIGMDQMVPAAVSSIAVSNVVAAALLYLFGYGLIVLAGVIAIGLILRTTNLHSEIAQIPEESRVGQAG